MTSSKWFFEEFEQTFKNIYIFSPKSSKINQKLCFWQEWTSETWFSGRNQSELYNQNPIFDGPWFQNVYGTTNFVARYENDSWDVIGPLFYGRRTYHGAFMIDGTIFWNLWGPQVLENATSFSKLDQKCLNFSPNIHQRYKNVSFGWIRAKLDVSNRGYR